MTAPETEEDVYTAIELSLQFSQAGYDEAAEQLLFQSLEVLEKKQQQSAELRSMILHLLANSLKRSGKPSISTLLYKRAWSLLKESDAQEIPLSLYEDLYCHYLSEQDLDKAFDLQLELFNDSKRTCSRMLKEKNLLRLLAFSWFKASFSEASKYLSLLLQVTAQDSSTINFLELQALFAFKQKRFEDSEILLKELLENPQKMEKSDIAESLSRLGLVLCAQGKDEEAELQCRQAAELRADDTVRNEEVVYQLREIADFFCLQNCKHEASKLCLAALAAAENEGTNEKLLLYSIFERLGLREDRAALESRLSVQLGN